MKRSFRLWAPKIPARVSSISLGQADILRAHSETEALMISVGSHEAEVYVAVVLNRAGPQVSRAKMTDGG